MWRRLPEICVLCLCMELWLALVAHSLPLFDAGPHVYSGWGESIRIRRLYTARKHGQDSYYLRIHDDGRVDGERHESSHNLLEIRSVSIGIVAIKGYHSSLYLCMGSDGALYGMNMFSHEECSFKEELLPDGYNMYKSQKYGLPISLSKDRQRLQAKGKGYPPLSHFLPVKHHGPIDNQSREDDDIGFQLDDKRIAPDFDSMDPLGFLDDKRFHHNNRGSGRD